MSFKRERERERRKRFHGDAEKARLLASTLSIILILGLLGAQIPVVRAAETLHVGSGQTYSTIQDAVNAAALSGDTIIVHPATYDEQVVTTKSLTLQGYGDTTIVKPSSAAKLTTVLSGHFFGGTKQIAGIIVANVPSGASVAVKNLKVDESSVTTKPTGADYFAGIFYRETGGTVDTVSVAGGGAWSGGDRGYGVYLSAITNPVSVEVKGSTITNYDKNGIDAHGNKLTANIHHNTITGRGLIGVGDEVQNGVNIMDGAVGTVNYNIISNMAYTPLTWLSAGILFYNNGGTANGNTITDCQLGIIFQDGNAIAEGNTVNGGTVMRRGLGWQRNPGFIGMFTVSFKWNTISNVNDIGGTDGYAIAVIARTGFSCTLTVDNNQLTGGGSTTADGIYVGADGGSVVATITDNTISGWEYGMFLLRTVASGSRIEGNTIVNNVNSGIYLAESQVTAGNIRVNFNNIVGNQIYGVNNGGTGTLDAEHNWWGSATGPTHASNPGGTGDKVSNNVDFTPWLTASTTGSDIKTVPAGTTTTVGSSVLGVTSDVTTTTGTPTVTVVTYSSNPGGAPPFSALGKYVDVQLDNASGVSQIMIKVYYTDAEVAAGGVVESSLKLYWWNGASWVVCSETGVDIVANYIWARITVTSTPNLSQLVGTPFGGGVPLLRYIKQDAMAELKEAKTGDDKMDKNIDRIIKDIEESLEDELWLNDMHLDPKHGHKVFDREKAAVEKIQNILNDKDLSPMLRAALEKVIGKLVTADKMLAETALNDAKAIPDPGKKIVNEIEKSEEELAKAAKALAKGDPEKAIDHYKYAWKYAQDALKHAP